MKNSIILLCLVCLTNPISAQIPFLYIEYEAGIDMAKIAPGLGAERIKVFNNLVNVYSYAYSRNCSEYKKIAVRKKDPTISGGKIISKNDVIFYKDFGRKLIYKKSVENPEWVSKETMSFDRQWKIDYLQTDTVAGHLCCKAITKENQYTIIAWFAPGLSIKDGPMALYGLPGLILRVELGAVTISATHMSIIEETREIKMPEAEKYLSSEEFDKITGKNGK